MLDPVTTTTRGPRVWLEAMRPIDSQVTRPEAQNT